MAGLIFIINIFIEAISFWTVTSIGGWYANTDVAMDVLAMIMDVLALAMDVLAMVMDVEFYVHSKPLMSISF